MFVLTDVDESSFYFSLVLLSFLYTMIAGVVMLSVGRQRQEVRVGGKWFKNPLAWLAFILLGALCAYFVTGGIALEGGLLYISIFSTLLPLLIFIGLGLIYGGWRGGFLRAGLSLIFAAVFMSGIALLVNSFFMSSFSSLLAGATYIIMVIFFAPLIEEASKIVLVQYAIKESRPALSIAIFYGFAMGIGFSIIENLIYVSSGAAEGAASWTGLVLYRSFFSSLSHSYAAIAGAIGYAIGRGGVWRRASLGLSLAFCLHALYNEMSMLKPMELLGIPVSTQDLLRFIILALTIGLIWVEVRMRGKEKLLGKL